MRIAVQGGNMPENHEDRTTYYGGYDCSALAGCNPWMRPIDTYANRLRLAAPKDQNEAMSWGLRTQDAILDHAVQVLGIPSDSGREIFLRDKIQPYYGGTADLFDGRRGIDAKNVRFRTKEWGDEWTDEVPQHILMQCHHYIELFGAEVWYVAALFSGQSFKIYEIRRDAELGEMIRDMYKEFEEKHVIPKVPPEVDYGAGWKSFLQSKYPVHSETVRDATPIEVTLVDQYRNALHEAELVAKNIESYENQLRAAIGENQGLNIKGVGVVSWKSQKGQSRLDTKALKEQMPEVYKKFTKEGEPVRVLRKRWIDEKEE